MCQPVPPSGGSLGEYPGYNITDLVSSTCEFFTGSYEISGVITVVDGISLCAVTDQGTVYYCVDYYNYLSGCYCADCYCSYKSPATGSIILLAECLPSVDTFAPTPMPTPVFSSCASAQPCQQITASGGTLGEYPGINITGNVLANCSSFSAGSNTGTLTYTSNILPICAVTEAGTVYFCGSYSAQGDGCACIGCYCGYTSVANPGAVLLAQCSDTFAPTPAPTPEPQCTSDQECICIPGFSLDTEVSTTCTMLDTVFVSDSVDGLICVRQSVYATGTTLSSIISCPLPQGAVPGTVCAGCVPQVCGCRYESISDHSPYVHNCAGDNLVGSCLLSTDNGGFLCEALSGENIPGACGVASYTYTTCYYVDVDGNEIACQENAPVCSGGSYTLSYESCHCSASTPAGLFCSDGTQTRQCVARTECPTTTSTTTSVSCALSGFVWELMLSFELR
jgi:hypothetical protein